MDKISRITYICGVMFVVASVAKAEAGLMVSWQYYRHSVFRDAGSIHIGWRNTSAKPLCVKSIHVDGRLLKSIVDPDRKKNQKIWARGNEKLWNRKKGGRYLTPEIQPGEVMWHWLTQEKLAPGEMAELIIKFHKIPTKPVSVTINTEHGQKLECLIEPVPPKLTISSATFSKDLRKIYIYVTNRSSLSFEISKILLNGRDETKKAKFVSPKIEPNSKGCIVLKNSKPLPQGERIYLMVATKSGLTIGCSIRTFSYFAVAGSGGVIQPKAKFDWDGLNPSKPYTKEPYYKLDVVGYEIIANRNNPNYLKLGQLMYYWSNQGFIKTGVWAFGELVDGARLHLQPSETEYIGAYHSADHHYVQAKMRFIRRALAPHPVFPQTEVGHALMSAFYESVLTPEEMRLRVYYLMSRGGKGVLYRCGGGELAKKSTPKERKALETEMAALSEELFAMRPYLRIAEFVDGMAKTSEPLVEAASLLCGDKGLVVLLLNHDRQQSWPKNEMYLGKSFWVEPKPDPITVAVNVPEPMKPKLVLEIRGKNAFYVPFKLKNGKLIFVANGIKTTRQYVILSQGEKIPDDWLFALPVKKAKRIAGPDVQFKEKQYFWGTVPPDREISHDFICRNVGAKPLHLKVDKYSNGVTIQLPHKSISPGQTGTVHISCQPTGPKGHAIVWLKTNDPNEPRVRLELGGHIVAPFVVSPNEIVLRKMLYGKNISTAQVLITDEKGGELKFEKPIISTLEIKTSHTYKDYFITMSHGAVYQSQRVKRVHVLKITADLSKRDESSQEWMTIKTNSDWKPEIKIPIAIEVEPAVLASPSRLFFGVISEPSVRTIRLHSPLGGVTVEEASAKEETLSLKIEKNGNDVLLKVFLRGGKQEKRLRGKIRIRCKVAGRTEELDIPYFAIIKPTL